jgi:hypothetical protein
MYAKTQEDLARLEADDMVVIKRLEKGIGLCLKTRVQKNVDIKYGFYVQHMKACHYVYDRWTIEEVQAANAIHKAKHEARKPKIPLGAEQQYKLFKEILAKIKEPKSLTE